jgi:hypothetical protein
MFFSTLEKTSSKQARANRRLQKQISSGVNSQVRLFAVQDAMPLPTMQSETKFALECFKRRRELEERFRRARTKSGKARFVLFRNCRTVN